MKGQVNPSKLKDPNPVTVHKLLIGKLKDCELKFRLILEILII